MPPASDHIVTPYTQDAETKFHWLVSNNLKQMSFQTIYIYSDVDRFFKMIFPYYAPFLIGIIAPGLRLTVINRISEELRTFYKLGLAPGMQNDYYFPPSSTECDELGYLSLLQRIRMFGEPRPDRTGVGTLSTFGEKVVYALTGNRIPLFTTKHVSFRNIVEELLFFVRGDTDTQKLEQKGVKIWQGNTTAEFLKGRDLPYRQGDMGPMYGFQWRHAGVEYEGAEKDYSNKGLDQLAELVAQIKKDPFSRRHLLVSWNAAQISQMVLAPCHILAHFSVSADGNYLDCLMYQRSGDMFLGVPYNVASYGLLTHMVAKQCGLRARRLVHMLGDAHIYQSHVSQVEQQLLRLPTRAPSVRFRKKPLDEYVLDDFEVLHYHPHRSIKAKMAI